MTEDEVAYAAAQALMEMEAGAVVHSVRRLPDKPFGWAVVFAGASGSNCGFTFEHRAEDGAGSLREKIRAGLGGLAR